MPTGRVVEEKRIASASFVWTWDEARALDRALPKLRKELRAAGTANSGMRFRNPWGGLNHTEFSLVVEVAKGATAGAVATLSKWLLDWGRDFLKEYRKQGKVATPPKQKPRPRPSAKRTRGHNQRRRKPVTFTATFIGQTGDDCSYQIEERNEGELARAFIATIPCHQRASANGWEDKSDERKVELWCKHHSRELPKDGERIRVDLDEVTKD